LESFRYLELGDKNFTDLIKDELTGGFGFAGEIIICIAKIKLSLSDIPSNPTLSSHRGKRRTSGLLLVRRIS
jgi:hypothetical protein